MVIHFYNSALEYIGREEAFTSLSWSEQYNERGVFSGSLPEDAAGENAIITAPGNYLYRDDRNTAMVIVKREIKNGVITFNGYSTLHLLTYRVLHTPVRVQQMEVDMYTLVSDNLRGLSDVAVAVPEGLVGVCDTTIEPMTLYEACKQICVDADFGMVMSFDPDAGHTFDVYVGRDYRYNDDTGGHVFAAEFGNLSSLDVVQDDGVYATTAYVIYEGKEKDPITGNDRDVRYVYTVGGDIQGLARREIVITASGKPEPGQSIEQYCIAKGQEELNKRLRVQTFIANVDADAFGVEYDLGDYVTCVHGSYGLVFDTRIKAFTEIISATAPHKVTLTFGENKINFLRELIYA